MDRQILFSYEFTLLIRSHNAYLKSIKNNFGFSEKVPFYLSSMIIDGVLHVVVQSVFQSRDKQNILLITYMTDKGQFIHLLNNL